VLRGDVGFGSSGVALGWWSYSSDVEFDTSSNFQVRNEIITSIKTLLRGTNICCLGYDWNLSIAPFAATDIVTPCNSPFICPILE